MKKRILIAEDEGLILKDLQDRLVSLGYEVVGTAVNGESVVVKAGELVPDLILMDIMLKGPMDGVAAAAAIRREADIPVVYLSGYAEEETLARAKITDPFGYVLKPVEERELHTVIEMALHKHAMERRLKENTEWLSTILASIAEGVVATGADGAISFINGAAQEITGWKGADALGKPIKTVCYLLDENNAPFDAGDCLSEGEDNRRLSGLRLCRSDNQQRFVALAVSRIAGARGKVVVLRDVTEEKRIQAQLIQSSKMAGIGTLAGGVAHEFNNLIAIMRARVEYALVSNEAKDMQDALGVVMVSTERAAKITQSLLNFSKRIKPQLEQADIARIMEDTLPLLERELIKQHIELVKHYSAAPEIWVDIGQIQQVFLNLLVNAKEVMPSGGTLTIDIRGGSDSVEVCIGDTGGGIDQNHVHKIFEPFFSTKSGLKQASGSGTGLGLSVSLGIIENHGGTIRVESGAAGTSFLITLPVHIRPTQGAVAYA